VSVFCSGTPADQLQAERKNRVAAPDRQAVAADTPHLVVVCRIIIAVGGFARSPTA
jgi:hypothetical protein